MATSCARVLLTNLLAAVDDEHQRVRIEALYTFGAIAPPAAGAYAEGLIKALDHYDPAIRAGAARVIGRLKVKAAGEALIKAMNDSQQPVRFAAMRALGDIGEPTAIRALTEQLDHYRKGEGAWSALDALARIGYPSSVPAFTARLSDKDPFMRRAAAEGLARAKDTASRPALESAVSTDSSDMVRAAFAFALQQLGGNFIARLANSLDSDKLAPQIAGYFLELGPPAAGELAAHLQDPSEAVRGNVATILGAIGGPTERPAAAAAAGPEHRRSPRRRACDRADHDARRLIGQARPWLVARCPSVKAAKTIVRMQHATIVMNTPFHPQLSAIQPTPVPAIADPNT